MDERVFNFGAGPAVLPQSVLEEAQRDMLSLPGVGMSILEVSHRSKTFVAIIEEAEANIRQLLALPDNYQVLFLQGGSRLQFSMVPMNLLRGHPRGADYVTTGSWGSHALKEAQREGTVRIAYDGKATNYDRLPRAEDLELDPQAAYVHVTSNETIQGVQFPRELATSGVPLVSDQSSDFLSRPLDISRYGMIYACAQKNAGPAGVTVVIIRDDLLERGSDELPSMLNYRTHAQEKSLYNTPPCFSIYVLTLVTRWLLNDIGGLEQMDQRNRKKAQLLYDVLDQYPDFYQGHAQADCRSLMNVTFRLTTPDLEGRFLEEAESLGMCAMKGHRSVGGFRASIYNAMPEEGVLALRDFMLDFRAKHEGR
jgi:phosphoserine aminotransferase